jgi:2-iminobutanoate/2-iminopropanoate deaminase
MEDYPMGKTVHSVEGFMTGAPFSHIVESGGFLFLSGVLPVDIKRNIRIMNDVKEATELVLTNIKYALESVGSGLPQVVKTTVFIRDMSYFDDINDVYRKFFPVEPPARSCIAVKEVPGNYPLEIEVIACR